MSLQAPSRPDLRQEVHNAARRARAASRTLGLLPTVAKDEALHSAAEAITANTRQILAANAEDLKAARAAGTPTAMLDRLALDAARVDGIAAGLRQVAGLPDRSVRYCAVTHCPTGCYCVSNGYRWAWSG